MRPGLPLWYPATLIATGFGIGRAPFAPGSFGSLAALAIAWAIRGRWGIPGLAVAFALVFVIGCWAAGAVAETSGVRDPPTVVVDEIAGQWLALLAAPASPGGWGAAFLLFRLFDIWKPWPVRRAERVNGGLGIMLDDLLAAGYAAISSWGLLEIGGVLG
jgi:phosphatidylglycerophosphatase A